MKMKEIRCIIYVFMCIFNFIYIMLYIILNDGKKLNVLYMFLCVLIILYILYDCRFFLLIF